MSGFIGTKLTMNLGERSYDIIVKSGSLENLYQFARLDRRVAVVTDSGVPAQYAQMVADQCKDAHIITVPQGEASKSFKILESVLRQMLEFGMGRGDLVIAVGGGAGTLSEIALAWSLKRLILAYKNVEGWSGKVADTRMDLSLIHI